MRDVLGQATLNFVAVATLLFFFFCECPKFCDLAKQRRKIFWGVPEVRKIDFAFYLFWLGVFCLVFLFSSAAIARRDQTYRDCRDESGAEALAVLDPPHHTHNHDHKGTHNPPTWLLVVSQSYMVLISAQTYVCTLSSVLGRECNRVGFPPMRYPPGHRSQDRSKPPPHTTVPWGGMQ